MRGKVMSKNCQIARFLITNKDTSDWFIHAGFHAKTQRVTGKGAKEKLTELT